jgi:hypothetical protein
VMPGPSLTGFGYRPLAIPRNQADWAIGRSPLDAGRPLRGGWFTRSRRRMKGGSGAVIRRHPDTAGRPAVGARP